MSDVIKYELGNITIEDQKLFDPIYKSFLYNHNNSKKKVKSGEIRNGMRRSGYMLNDAQFRKIIGYMRSVDYFKPGFILSDGDGYWYSEDISEMKKFYSSMKFRALSILHNVKPLFEKLKEDKYRTMTEGETNLFKNI